MTAERTYTLYILVNKVNGKRYVGQTTRPLEQRVCQHRNGNSVISKAIQKYGIDNFETTSFTAPSIDALNRLEIALIDGLDSLTSKHGYNIREGGDNSLMTADEKAHLREVWDIDKRQLSSRKMKRWWTKKIARCKICGKDESMGYDPEFDFRLCPSCRQTRHLSQDLGLDCPQF